MSIAAAQLTVDFVNRFGHPILERFKTSEGLRLSVEYRKGGDVRAIEVAPQEYRGYNPFDPVKMSGQTANQILEDLLPGVTSDGVSSEELIRTTNPGFWRELRRVPGLTLRRDYPLGADRSKMIAAIVSLEGSDSHPRIDEVVAGRESPEYQRFDAGSGVAVGVYYGRNRAIEQIDLSVEKGLLDTDEDPRPLEREQVERLLKEFYPESSKTNKPRRNVFLNGALKRERESYGNVLLWRNYVNEELVAAGLIWRQVR